MPHDETDKLLIPRRSFFKGAGALALAPLLMGLGGKSSFAAPSDAQKRSQAKNFNTKLVLLGTTGGMTWWPGSNRASASQALVVGDAMYIIDLGFGATQRLAEAFNHARFVTIDGEKTQLELSTFLKNVRAVFFTHLHMDHLGDYTHLSDDWRQGRLRHPESVADHRSRRSGKAGREPNRVLRDDHQDGMRRSHADHRHSGHQADDKLAVASFCPEFQ